MFSLLKMGVGVAGNSRGRRDRIGKWGNLYEFAFPITNLGG